MSEQTDGEVVFEEYLGDTGPFRAEREPELGIRSLPDYSIERNGQRCIAEVKEFSVGPRVKAEPDVRIRRTVGTACAQLKPACGLEVPLIVVLTDPKGALAGHLGQREVEAAVRRELNTHHGYLSAVIVLHEPLEGLRFAEIFHTGCPEAVPLPHGFFSGPADQTVELNIGRVSPEDIR